MNPVTISYLLTPLKNIDFRVNIKAEMLGWDDKKKELGSKIEKLNNVIYGCPKTP